MVRALESESGGALCPLVALLGDPKPWSGPGRPLPWGGPGSREVMGFQVAAISQDGAMENSGTNPDQRRLRVTDLARGY
jgi:hypothetical protein